MNQANGVLNNNSTELEKNAAALQNGVSTLKTEIANAVSELEANSMANKNATIQQLQQTEASLKAELEAKESNLKKEITTNRYLLIASIILMVAMLVKSFI